MDSPNVTSSLPNQENPPTFTSSPRSKNLLITLGLVLMLIILIGLAYRIYTNKRTQTQETSSKQPTVSLVKEYNNPFDKKNQYVNPFSDYKNPFDTLK